jgi:hypothetical protein
MMRSALRKVTLYALMVTTAVAALAVVLWSAAGFLMMVVGDCGVTAFDFADRPLQLSFVLAVPAVFVFVAVKVWRYCSRRLPFSSLR